MRRRFRVLLAGLLAAWSALVPGAAHAAALNLVPDPALVALNVAVFLLLVWPTNRLVLRPLVRIVEERDRRTTGAASRAEELGAEAARTRAELERREEEALRRALEGRLRILADAEERQRALLERARGDAAQTLEEVRSAIRSEASEARVSLEGEARALAREAASRILGRPL